MAHKSDAFLPRLHLLKQTSLCEDQDVKNKSGKIVHVVVKNSPFTLTFGFNETSTGNSALLDLHKYNLEVKLLYDANSEKEVDFVKDRPVAHKISLNQSGTKLTVEVRIKVLTSQLEDMLFKVGVFAHEPITKHSFISYSEAIRVISKSDQVKKKSTSRKREVSDCLTDNLSQIESKQDEYVNLLRTLIDKNKIMIDSSSSIPSFKEKKQPPVIDFSTAFSEFLQTYTAVQNPEERRTKIRRVMASTPTSQIGSVAELSDLFMAEGLSRELGTNKQNLHTIQATPIKHEPSAFCTCPACPYKKELRHIEEFYEDIFSQNSSF